MKRIWTLLFCFIVFLLAGCESNTQTHTVIFDEDIQIEYQREVNTATFVKRVDSFVINDSMIDGNKINVSNFEVICPKLEDYKKLGKIQLVYKIDDERYSVEAEIIDTEKPKIVAEEEYTFEVNQMNDISEYYTVTDNFDSESDINVKVKGLDQLDSTKEGTYSITVVAKDSSNNKTEKTIHIVIKDSEKEQREKEQKEAEEKAKVEAESQKQDQAQSSQTPSQNGQSQQTQQSSKPFSTKDYLFSQGYDMDSASSACYSDLMSYSGGGTCIPIQDSNGIYLGMRLTLN